MGFIPMSGNFICIINCDQVLNRWKGAAKLQLTTHIVLSKLLPKSVRGDCLGYCARDRHALDHINAINEIVMAGTQSNLRTCY